MVFSKLLDNLSSLLSSNDNKNEKNTENINKAAINELQQGMILLQTRKNNINKLKNKLSLIESMETLADKNWSKGKTNLSTATQTELDLLEKLQKDYQRQLTEYGIQYKTFMSNYYEGIGAVRKCRINCVSQIPNNGTYSSQQRQACQAGCAIKGPYVVKCENSYTTSVKDGENCDAVTQGKCWNGTITTPNITDLTSQDFADANGVSIKDGCCDCGGGIGGPPSYDYNGRTVRSCDDINKAINGDAYPQDTMGLKSKCLGAVVSNSEKNKELHTEYNQLTAKNEELIATAKTIFDKITALQKARKEIDIDMKAEDSKLDTQLADYGTIYAEIIERQKSKDGTIDGQLEDIREKELSSSLQFLIWSGLAILTILLVIQRLRR